MTKKSSKLYLKKKDFNFLYKVQRVRCLLIWNNWLVKQHRPKQKVLYPVHACCTITAKSSITFMNIVFFLSCQIFLGQKLYMLLKGKTKKKNSFLPLNSSKSILTCSPQSLKNYSHTFGPLCKNFFKVIHGERHVSRLVFQTCLLIKNKFCSILIFGMAKIPCSVMS